MILGGIAAHPGYLSLGWVISCGFIGTVLGDQLYFYLGRRHGPGLLARRPSWQNFILVAALKPCSVKSSTLNSPCWAWSALAVFSPGRFIFIVDA